MLPPFIVMGRSSKTRRAEAIIVSFRVGSIPVRVHPLLFLMGVLFGLDAQRGPLAIGARAIAFVLMVFAHELAHAVVARSFGLSAEVNLTPFGRVLGAQIASLPTVRRLFVCLAGPGLNLMVGAIIFALVRAHPRAAEIGGGALAYLGFINVGWGLLNLLPILPLDGGHALVAALDGVTRARGAQVVRWISIGSAVALGSAAIMAKSMFPALVCTMVLFQNAQALELARVQKNREALVRGHLDAAFSALTRGETAVAIAHCRSILNTSADPTTRKDAVRMLAYAYATADDWRNLMDLLESGGASALEAGELEKYQRAARELGRSGDAQRIALLGGLFA